MKKELNKIREAVERGDAQTKCQAVAEIYAEINENLVALNDAADLAETTLKSMGEGIDESKFEPQLDEMEAVLVELAEIMNPELQKVLKFLKPRFESHMYRHKNITWEQVEKRLQEADPKKLWSLNEMERTGGEPDVIKIDKKNGEVIFYDCSAESPTGRRNCVYDQEGEAILKKDYPNEKCAGNAVDMAAAFRVDLLTEDQYRELQTLGEYDRNSWSWLETPVDKREGSVALRGYRDEDVVRVAEHFPFIIVLGPGVVR